MSRSPTTPIVGWLVALAALMALVTATATAQEQTAPGPRLIAIDPGHGGADAGAVGRLPEGTQTGLPERRRGDQLVIYEKDINLDVAQRLDAWLRSQGYATLMTRTQDLAGGDRPYRNVRTDLAARVVAANQAQAAIFVSIHSNSLTSRSSGTETYHFYSASAGARALAEAIQQDVVARVGLPDRGVRRAGFYVLKYTSMPAVLVEVGFVSNPDEAVVLASPDTRQALAESIGTGIVRHLASEPVSGSGGGPVAESGPPPIKYWVTAGRFRTKRAAVRRTKQIRRQGLDAIVRRRYSSRLDRKLYYVVTGQFSYLANARGMRKAIRDLGLPGRVDAANPKRATSASRARP